VADEDLEVPWRAQLARVLHAEEASPEVSGVWQSFLGYLAEITPDGRLASPGRDLSEGEAAALAQGSAGLDVSAATTARQMARGAGAWIELVQTSATVGEVARRLGVQDSRIRQRLGNRTLYGFKEATAWRLPDFQFCEKQVLPGLDRVLPSVPRDVGPLTLTSWFQTPTPDLARDGHASAHASGSSPVRIRRPWLRWQPSCDRRSRRRL
jgi:hypothetical protein